MRWVLASYCSFPAVLGVSKRMWCDHFFPNANLFAGSRDNVVRIVKRLQTGLSGVWIPAGRRNLFLLQKGPNWLWSLPSLHWNGCRSSFSWVKRVRDKTLIELVPRLRTSGTIPVSPICFHGVYRDNFIIYNKPTRCNSGSIVFINNYKYAVHVSDAICFHLQEHYKL